MLHVVPVHTGSYYRARPKKRRRISIPTGADAECVAISDAYRLTYRHAVMLKVLSYGVIVSPGLLASLCGLIELEAAARRIRERTGLSIIRGNSNSRGTAWFLLDEASAREVRAVIHTAWVTE